MNRRTLVYCTDLFQETSVRRFISHYLTLMEQAAAEPSKPISAFSMMSKKDEQELLSWESGPCFLEEPAKTLIDLLREHTATNPDRIALFFETETGLKQEFSYRRLNKEARRVARTLIAKGSRPPRPWSAA